ncbi:MAG: undecaprenyl/decaprenyl-phosphate alpha-N-acetylglucosaminyl 1-phosphate transferase [bacterium]|nr:undecaprenyl/decaprenyl-phosphate alpha-N-acetylglucosaminyl 1-phosphate transferase [bacterium]
MLTYAGAMLLALIATPLMVRAARSWKVLDRPGTRKVHSVAIPRLGGVAVFVALVIPVVVLQLFDTHFTRILSDPSSYVRHVHVLALLVTGGIVFAIGLVDDMVGMGVRTKLVAQITAAAIACSMGIRIDYIGLSEDSIIEFGWWAWPLTILWVVSVTNAVNLIDGLDGLAAGISLIACSVLLVFAIHTQNVTMMVLMAAILGSLTGFLFFNFNPAKIFLGDCGSMFLGYFLATASVMCSMKSAALVGLALPAVALGLPIFDTLFSMLRRTLERRSMFAADRKHIHHRLIDMGLHQRHAVIIMYAITALAAGIGMLMILVKDAGGIALILIGALLPSLLVFRAVGAMRIREAFFTFQRNRTIAREAKGQRRDSEGIRLRLQEAETLDQWWKALRRAAREMGFARMLIQLDLPGEPARRLVWRLPHRQVGHDRMVQATFPMGYRKGGSPLRVEIDVPVDDALESTGTSLALFGRLLDECDLSRLRKLTQSGDFVDDQEDDTEERLEVTTLAPGQPETATDTGHG